MLCAKRFPDYEHIARTVLIDTEAEKWDPRVGAASHNCAKFLVSSVAGLLSSYPSEERNFIVGDAVATWALIHMLGRSLTTEEFKAVRPLGIAMTADLSSWWTQSA
jgi:hypothetical protein